MKFKLLTRNILTGFFLFLMAGGVLAASPAYRLYVDGLSCPFCAYGLEKKLGALKGVQRIETNIKDGAVIVTMQDGLALDEATAKKAVKDAGFTLRKLEAVQPIPPNKQEGHAK